MNQNNLVAEWTLEEVSKVVRLMDRVTLLERQIANLLNPMQGNGARTAPVSVLKIIGDKQNEHYPVAISKLVDSVFSTQSGTDDQTGWLFAQGLTFELDSFQTGLLVSFTLDSALPVYLPSGMGGAGSPATSCQFDRYLGLCFVVNNYGQVIGGRETWVRCDGSTYCRTVPNCPTNGCPVLWWCDGNGSTVSHPVGPRPAGVTAGPWTDAAQATCPITLTCCPEPLDVVRTLRFEFRNRTGSAVAGVKDFTLAPLLSVRLLDGSYIWLGDNILTNTCGAGANQVSFGMKMQCVGAAPGVISLQLTGGRNNNGPCLVEWRINVDPSVVSFAGPCNMSNSFPEAGLLKRWMDCEIRELPNTLTGTFEVWVGRA